MFRRFSKAWWLSVGTILAVLALLIVLVCFEPARVWAEGVLTIFRVQKITAVSFDPSQNYADNARQVADRFGRLLDESYQGPRDFEDPQLVRDVAAANQAAGFKVRLPTNQPGLAKLTVQRGLTFQFVVRRARVQALLNDLGYRNVKLPASVDGGNVKVVIPTSVVAEYGGANCVHSRPNCRSFVQMPSPSITMPPGLDIVPFAQIGLQAMGMTAEQARTFGGTVDWTSTFVVPIPRGVASHKAVQVDSVTGTLVWGQRNEYTLLWVRDGMIYGLAGNASQSEATALASSLKLN